MKAIYQTWQVFQLLLTRQQNHGVFMKQFPPLIAALLCFSFSTLGQVERTPIQEACLGVMKNLVSQTHHDYNAFLVPDGGLCGPACVLNALTAIRHLEGKPTDRSKDIKNFSSWAEGYASDGIERGLFSQQLADGAKAFLKSQGHPETVYTHVFINTPEQLQAVMHPSGANSFSIISVDMFKKGEPRYNGHYLLVTGHDPVRQEIYYLDPNYPNQERKFRYDLKEGEYYLQDKGLDYLKSTGNGISWPDYRLHLRAGITFRLGDKVIAPTKPPPSFWLRPVTGNNPLTQDASFISPENNLIPYFPKWPAPVRDPHKWAPPWGHPKALADTRNYDLSKTPDVRAWPEELILVPKERLSEIEELEKKMGEAKTYQSGVKVLSHYLRSIGIIQTFSNLELLHASAAPSSQILSHGILSAQELKTRGMTPEKMWGQNLGDGIYTIGAQGWGDANWGRNVYKISLKDQSILLANNNFAAAFVKLYREYRIKWKMDVDGNDGIFAPGLPQGVLGISGLISSMPWIYEDLEIQGASNTLEVLIKARQIAPRNIQLRETR